MAKHGNGQGGKTRPKKKVTTSISRPQGMDKLLKGQKKPDVSSLRGREAGTSSRDKQGKAIGSKANRSKKKKKDKKKKKRLTRRGMR